MVQSIRANLLLLLVVTSVLTAGTAWWMSTHKPFEDAPDRPADTDLVHGNDDRNMRPHIVYEIYAIPTGGKPITLKYGISGQRGFVTRPGHPRPEYQLPFLKMLPQFRSMQITYRILHRNIPGRLEAKRIEQQYVNKFFERNLRKPRLQRRPLPQMLKKLEL